MIPSNIAKIGKVADEESTRYALGGVYVSVKDGRYEAAATDMRRMFIVSGPAAENDPPVAATIGVKDLRRSVLLCDSPEVRIEQCEKDVAISHKFRRCIVEPIEGRFPRYRDCVPTHKPQSSIILSAKLLREMLEVFEEFIEPDNGIEFQFFGEGMGVVMRPTNKTDGMKTEGQELLGIIMPKSKDDA